MSNFLITGGAGFIGSHLVEHLLAKGHYVYVIDDFSTGSLDNLPKHSNLNVTKSCITEENLIKHMPGRIDGVFHLASIASVQKSFDEWVYANLVNLNGTINIFNLASDLCAPVVYASSAAVYGDNTSLPIGENQPVNPLSPYAMDKYSCEIQAKLFAKEKGLRSYGLRLFNVYGDRQAKNSDYSGVITIFRDLIKSNKEITIHDDGNQSRDFIHVKDVVRAMELAMDNATIEASFANICTGNSLSINQIIEKISKFAKIKGRVYSKALTGSIRHSLGNPAKAYKELGFKAELSIDNFLKEFFK